MGRTKGATALPLGVSFACACLHAGGYGYREIARLLGRSPTAVRRAVEASRLPAITGPLEDSQHRQVIELMRWVQTGTERGYFRAMESLGSPGPGAEDSL